MFRTLAKASRGFLNPPTEVIATVIKLRGKPTLPTIHPTVSLPKVHPKVGLPDIDVKRRKKY